MLLSLAFIFLCGILLGGIFHKCKLPPLMGMLLTGILLGPYALNLLDSSILTISPDLRKIALIIILTRAGLNLDILALKKAGRPAFFMCFIPACLEIIGVLLFAPKLLNVSLLEAAVIGSVLAAVSPAVIVPKMLHLTKEGYGKAQHIPQIIMAGASVDDVFVIVLFTSFTALANGQSISLFNFARIPLSICSGILGGIVCGFALAYLFHKLHIRDSIKVMILLCFSFLLVVLEEQLTGIWGFSGLIAVMTIGILLQYRCPEASLRLSVKYSKLWVGAEILLFVLVGATVNITYALEAGVSALLLIVIALAFRMIGVYLCFLKTTLSLRERCFCMIAYCPKATVQAAIGSIPFSMGLACGNIVLTIAVVSILITAPLGALAIDWLHPYLLKKDTTS